ncbi:MAG: dihydroorotate dehydrogenase [Gemmatimonas sp.]|jgi:dihydroorotate dehydrogenase (NAD+) catalytic subunit|uniref:dihydroorotate dehydrogenase n=3 Tax=Gemmatimonas sp. TaxID=1962908 RepID=UPI0022CBB014|nr:dihydroorotate dehydrogenase [Gemmatimonas sp.]MCA2984438.1 dihydroorotate dehydrogenase [Gemmatimonas sp.]MCA2988874.1 dihydroorotate dehydrogenase [Gemmatimonas sp.]MCA2994503.1 dihydroorotate dehydrogenase [Gemmatimonas sp.]MCE2954057.1 dihydroorotate dehydrogenase [Gemmatimonas sp.]MCZ8013403.1 dihydroorotate dehydrogenase [Gemmatimonas sp.]
MSLPATQVAGLTFRNPVVLASGTAGFGMEIEDVVDLDAVGAIATKAVSVAPRPGNPALRVSEFAGGMINAIGLANPGLDAVVRDYLPWLPRHHPGTRVFVNVVGNSIDDFATVVGAIDGMPGIDAFELNVSCPNVKAGGLEFGADQQALAALVSAARTKTSRPIFVKLSPTLGAAITETARVAVDSGATGLTLVNTMPGLVIDTHRRKPKISFGSGGLSGPAVLPIGLLATWRVSRALPGVPLIGLGGVSTGDDAIQYLLAGASLVGVGTAALRDPRAPERIARQMAAWAAREGVRDLTTIIGTLEWPT